ncbi:MAG: G-D-S-L family lipolytic protein [Flavobacteriaceae bacterium]|nr:G-D-S-L family lipolytic protein [Flavobacteriaceae bacterium]
MKRIILSALAFISLMSCNTDFEKDVVDIKITQGEADFSTYVALGNSLTSGYRDGAVYLDGQQESYPAIIAEQMRKAGGGEFTQPLVPDNIGGFAGMEGFSGKLTLKNVNGQLLPVPSVAKANLDKVSGSFNNMGVSGAKSFHLLAPNYGDASGLATKTANPYFVRFASSPTTTVLQDAMAKKPTFFSLWIGNNDVLSYAISGGVGVNQTGNLDVKTYASNDITDPQVLAGSIKNVLDGLKSVGATKGVIANIPDVTTIPFFTTIPYNSIPLTEEESQQLNGGLLANLKVALTHFGEGDRIVLTKAGQNPVLIKDESLKDLSGMLVMALKNAGVPDNEAEFLGKTYGQVRHATNGDYILLTTKSILGTNPETLPNFIYGATYPLADAHVLTKNEVSEIQTATNAYNQQIKALAEMYGLAFVDANAKMKELNSNSGIKYNGVNFTTTFVRGGSFSLDGVHLTGKGYAVIANEFIKAINTKYQSTLPQVNPNQYSGVIFP